MPAPALLLPPSPCLPPLPPSRHEIATHTMTHAGLPNASEIVGARTWLNQARLPAAGACWRQLSLEPCAQVGRSPVSPHPPQQEALIPLNKIRGYRAPFLLHDPAQRKVLACCLPPVQYGRQSVNSPTS